MMPTAGAVLRSLGSWAFILTITFLSNDYAQSLDGIGYYAFYLCFIGALIWLVIGGAK